MSRDDLLSATQSLFPDSEARIGRVDRHNAHSMRLIPPGPRARLAIPSFAPSAASMTIRRPSAGDTRLRALLRDTIAISERISILPILTPQGIIVDRLDGSIVDHLSNIFGDQVTIGLMVGSARANQKPVLNVFSSTGDELGFAKVGLGALSHQLVTAEADALRTLARMSITQMHIPRVITSEPWRGCALLVMSPLRPDRSQSSLPLPSLALRELAEPARTSRATIRDSTWARVLTQEGAASGHATPLGALTEEFLDRYGEEEWDFAPWHGDFGPWNMARTSTVPMVWDWERFAREMPCGLDALHFLAHRTIAATATHALPIETLLKNAERSLAPYEGLPRVPLELSSHLVLGAYLLTYAVRFVNEGRAHDVPRTTRLGLIYAHHLRRLLDAGERTKKE